MNPENRTAGLTIVEVLIAMVILGLLTAFMVSPVVNSIRASSSARDSASASSQTRRVMEGIRAQWVQDPSKYAANCVPSSAVSIPPAVSVSVADVTPAYTATNATSSDSVGTFSAVTASGSCTTGLVSSVPVKRLVVTFTGQNLSRLSVDVPNPATMATSTGGTP